MVVYPTPDNRIDRMNNVQVIFDGQIVDTLQQPTGDNKQVIVNIDKRGRRGTKNVTLYREVTKKDHCDSGAYPSMALCEVEIYTCTAGKWGQSCDQQCGDQCPECRDNASDCLECKEGFWGANTCANNCGQGCESGNCSFANGTCQCREPQQQHWAPPKCESCIEKYWGDNCSVTCPPNCQGPCNKTNGQCEGCREKYWGDKCENTCPTNCQGPCKKTDGQCEVTPPPTSPPPTAASPPSEKKFPMWAAALIALGILGLIALVAFLVWRKRRQAQGPAQAPEGGPNENPEGEAEGEGEMSSQAEQSAEGTEESQQASEGGEAAPAE
ncbi:scavenger receptor class F member 1-like [Pomacea canaliculata]|uniref:scavenger receptor class F member 1-like n=1 Tax=Pomacea canaliculata TaxID=400727 RepID=UPI000D73AC9F|nr:scavenger receptor class F member 1-like [Pomacea canaliculata]